MIRIYFPCIFRFYGKKWIFLLVGTCRFSVSALARFTIKIFPRIFYIATNFVIWPFLSIVPFCISTKVGIVANWNTLFETFARWQSLDTRPMFQMMTNIISKVETTSSQPACCLPSYCFSKIFKLKQQKDELQSKIKDLD